MFLHYYESGDNLIKSVTLFHDNLDDAIADKNAR